MNDNIRIIIILTLCILYTALMPLLVLKCTIAVIGTGLAAALATEAPMFVPLVPIAVGVFVLTLFI